MIQPQCSNIPNNEYGGIINSDNIRFLNCVVPLLGVFKYGLLFSGSTQTRTFCYFSFGFTKYLLISSYKSRTLVCNFFNLPRSGEQSVCLHFYQWENAVLRL